MSGEILNIELKARCHSIETLEQILIDLGGNLSGVDKQIDTYFNCDNGRLKLREGNIENALIYYLRSDDASARESHIIYEKTNQNINLKNLLSSALGVKRVVNKVRSIYYLNNVKIHFDKLLELGEFVEIEAIDEDKSFTQIQLKEQCDFVFDKFKLKSKDIIKFSYSDLVCESFSERISREASEFFTLMRSEFENLNLNLHMLKKVDHLCYRAHSEDDYKELKREFLEISDILVESIIGGREITTFKFLKPLINEVYVLELAAPKLANTYATGFEHIEIVTENSFEEIMETYNDIVFDIQAIGKKMNPEIRIIFNSGASVKFHHKSLEHVIEYEKTGVYPSN